MGWRPLTVGSDPVGSPLAPYLTAPVDGGIDAATIWVHRFYDVSATTLARHPEDFSIERAAADLFELVQLLVQIDTTTWSGSSRRHWRRWLDRYSARAAATA